MIQEYRSVLFIALVGIGLACYGLGLERGKGVGYRQAVSEADECPH